MRKPKFLIVFLSFLFVFSCNTPKSYIIETDIANISENASKNGLTVEEDHKLGKLIFDSVAKNTVGKSVPIVMVTNLSGKKLNLLNELNQSCILISSDIYCGFGLDCMTNLFPKAVKQFNEKNAEITAICLLKKTDSDNEDPERFNKNLVELKSLYKTIYIITDAEARKLNLNMNPTRLYVNKQQIVTHIEYGIPDVEDLCKEIERNSMK